MPSEIIPTTYRLKPETRERLRSVAIHYGLPSEAAAIRYLTDRAFEEMPAKARKILPKKTLQGA